MNYSLYNGTYFVKPNQCKFDLFGIYNKIGKPIQVNTFTLADISVHSA